MATSNSSRPAPNAKDMTGQVVGRLTLLERIPSERINGRSRARYRCQCECGNITVATSDNLKANRTLSCGCLQRERASETSKTHGASRSKIYRIWASMIGRCTNTRDPRYADYGGRGILVCERWKLSFEAFRDDMGPRPSSKHSVDRINNDGNYEPSNCRWATSSQQSLNSRHNRLVEVNGNKIPLSEACRRVGAPYGRTRLRMNRGQSFDQAVA